MLLPVYRRAKADPVLAALAARVNRRDPATVDAWLRAMPLSPLDEHAITRLLARSEHPLRKPTVDLHRRWLALHPEEGRRLHGDDAVDEALRGYASESADPAAPAATGGAGAASAPAAANATTVGAVGVNRNLAKSATTRPYEYQGEIQLVVDPRDPDRIVAAANTWDDMAGACGTLGMLAVFHTADGGATWSYACAPDQADFGAAFPSFDCPNDFDDDFGSDPALAWGPDGKVYLEYMLLCANATTQSYRTSIVVAVSADGGATWSPRGVVKDSLASPGAFEDKNLYAIDSHATSPFLGRHYTCWDRSNDQKAAYSEDAGATWTEVDLPEPAFGVADIGCDLAVADDGTVHVVWNRLDCGALCTAERMYASRSTDGGESWSAPALVHTFQLVGFSNANCPTAQDGRCINSFGSLAWDASSGPCRGSLLVAFTDIPSGASEPKVEKTNVYVRRSTDGGATWGAATKINSGDRYALATQFHPWLEVDRGTGIAHAGWHDTRNSGSLARVNFFVGRSEDCGATWADQQVSAASAEFHNKLIAWSNESGAATIGNAGANPNQFGEYLGLDVVAGRTYLAWSDSRHYFPASPADPQAENVAFVTVTWTELFRDGFETGDARIWSDTAP